MVVNNHGFPVTQWMLYPVKVVRVCAAADVPLKLTGSNVTKPNADIFLMAMYETVNGKTQRGA